MNDLLYYEIYDHSSGIVFGDINKFIFYPYPGESDINIVMKQHTHWGRLAIQPIMFDRSLLPIIRRLEEIIEDEEEGGYVNPIMEN